MVLPRFSRFVSSVLLAAWLPAAALAATASVQDANLAFRQGNNVAALDKVNGFLAANPKDAQGRFLKGLILTELNRHNEAIKLFTELTEDYPELPEPYNNLAVLYAAQGQYDQAKHALEMAIRTHPSYATAHENLGDIYAKMASVSYDKALQLDKSNTSAMTKLALIRDLFSPAQGMVKATPVPAKVADAGGNPGKEAAPVKAAVEQPVAKPVEKPPVQAAKPVEKPAAQVARDPKDDVLNMVQAWADAWSRRDAAAYLAFYGENFKVPGRRARADWETERKDRITRPEFIKVELDRIKVKLSPAGAKVSFQQQYTSNTLKQRGRKTLVLERQGDTWKIVDER